MSPSTSRVRRALVRFTLLAALVYPASLFTVLELPSPPTAEARSGGSGGGFSRSRSSSSGSRSSSSRSSSSRSSGGGFSSGGSSYGGGAIALSPQAMALIALVVFVFFIIGSIKAWLDKRAKEKKEAMTVGRVQLAFNALKSKGLRDRIEAAVRQGDVSTSRGIFRLGRTVCSALESELEHVSHVGFLERRDLKPDDGESEFNRLTQKARAFYDREIVRRDARGLATTTRNSSKANELTDEDGDFGIDEFFVVTVVMCVDQGPLGLPEKVGGHEDVRAAIATLLSVPECRHIGFEVVWTPAAESDILTRDELLVDFPELAPL